MTQRLAHRHPERVLARARGELSLLSAGLDSAMRHQLGLRRKAFGSCVAQLHALSPLAVLGRGYAIATRDGLPILSSQELEPGASVSVRVAHGSFNARVTRVVASNDSNDAVTGPVSEVRS